MQVNECYADVPCHYSFFSLAFSLEVVHVLVLLELQLVLPYLVHMVLLYLLHLVLVAVLLELHLVPAVLVLKHPVLVDVLLELHLVLAAVLHLCQVLCIFFYCGQFYCTHYSAQLCHVC
jgi:hypothetical protein